MGIQDRHTRHGESLCEFFRGEGRSRVAYSETYYREEQSAVPGLGPWHSLRIDNKHKVILDVNTQSLSVYDLTTDPNEKNPVHNGTDSTLLP
ncbi:MAG: hypothetical protein QNK37_31630 [Acidobacteriota bacterium]|nr:hypothetical protein [Acidobacteriota bacterium]